MDEAGKVDGTPIVASSEAPEMLEAAEASFDLISLLVEGFVVGDEDLSVPLGGDHRLGFHAGDYLTQVVAIIRFISKHGIGLLSFKKSGSGCNVVYLASRDMETERSAERIGQHMDLGGQPTSGTPQRLILGPPFPVAACW